MQERAISRSKSSTALCVFGFALITALCARIAMPLPYTTVPVTWQVAAVLFAGLMLGRRVAFASQMTYLIMGLAGAPLFANGMGGYAYLFNPMGTGGYLLAMPIAAWVVGAIAERDASRGFAARFTACLAGIAVIYSIGCLWLSAQLGLSLPTAVMAGAGWFLLWDIAKSMVVIHLAHRIDRTHRA